MSQQKSEYHPVVEEIFETDPGSPDFGRVKDIMAARAIAKEVGVEKSNLDEVERQVGRIEGTESIDVEASANRHAWQHTLWRAGEWAYDKAGGMPIRPNLKGEPWTLKKRIVKARKQAGNDQTRLAEEAKGKHGRD